MSAQTRGGRLSDERVAQLAALNLGGCAEAVAQMVALAREVQASRTMVERLRALHSPFGVYGECGHSHDDTEGGVVYTDATGLTCAHEFDVCRFCCANDDDDGQTEECATSHDHGLDKPLCPTRDIIDAIAEPTDAAPQQKETPQHEPRH